MPKDRRQTPRNVGYRRRTQAIQESPELEAPIHHDPVDQISAENEKNVHTGVAERPQYVNGREQNRAFSIVAE